MEKQPASLPPRELCGAGVGGGGLYAVRAARTPGPTQTPLSKLVRAQRSLCSLEQRPEHMSGMN